MILVGQIVIMVLALSGFILANYIKDTKKNATPLVCPLEGSCETVIHSEYSTLFGIPLETLGALYYGLISLLYFIFSFFPSVLPPQTHYLALALTICAFMFSIYLTAIQAVVIKHWCTWCLISAGICTIIFIFAIYAADLQIIEIVQNL